MTGKNQQPAGLTIQPLRLTLEDAELASKTMMCQAVAAGHSKSDLYLNGYIKVTPFFQESHGYHLPAVSLAVPSSLSTR